LDDIDPAGKEEDRPHAVPDFFSLVVPARLERTTVSLVRRETPSKLVTGPLTRIRNVYTFSAMDVSYELQGQVFEWDATKATTNRRKHHVSFEKACEVFFDPFVQVVDASDPGEAREAAIGLTEDWTPLFVVHIVRQGDTIRIISARKATPSERREYEHD
jgi:uncharacterized DUF497 family protein